MRKVTLKVKYRVPQGTELTRLVKKSAVSYIYIGYPARQGSESRKTMVQVNDKLATPAEITDYMSAEKSRMSPDDRERMTVSVKADRNTKMSVITDVKMALRRANIRRISYSAEKRK